MKRIAYIQYTNPALYPPLEHSSQILADNGWTVLFLGIGAWGPNTIRFADRPGITVRQLAYCLPGWRQKLHYAWFVLWAAARTLAFRSPWVYASDPLACPAGLLLSFVPAMRVIYHEHDSPTPGRDGSRDGRSPFMRFVLWTRRALAARAALCILPNERRAEQFTLTVGRGARVVCVWNCPTRNEVGASRPSLNGGDLWVVYQGSIVPARLPATIIEALARLPERVKLRVTGYGTLGNQDYAGQLRALAAKLGIANRLEIAGTVPTRAELFECCRQGDVGLAFMPKTSHDINEQAMTGASNKPFDYLACGLALLVSDLPEWRALYVEAGVGRPCDLDDPDSIAAALQWFLDHPDKMRAMGERGRKQILAEWHYEKQFQPVLDVLESSQHPAP